jgi:hypothetical protein
VRPLRATASSVGDELEQRAVRITEVDARAGSLRTRARDRAVLDGYVVRLKMLDRLRGRSLPDKAEVRVAWENRHARNGVWVKAWAVTVQQLLADAIGVPNVATDDFGAEHVSIKGVGPLPVADVNNDMVKRTDSHLQIIPNVLAFTHQRPLVVLALPEGGTDRQPQCHAPGAATSRIDLVRRAIDRVRVDTSTLTPSSLLTTRFGSGLGVC